ncbi:hypothetical protein GCM10011348_07560 [Marinobacterium nitratireducens]|uniref:Uncharacterized protein n=1 Tax=Marinobacterium nitratireducens TaxID=518897 RepID=A0A917Z8S9_9GAMM|nr:hypothetical protein [Marinobacterium nitratireducens]GGO77611.1 hypothetical protein GCM10011348_07560 [Marinobacterium nitratireducens]
MRLSDLRMLSDRAYTPALANTPIWTQDLSLLSNYKLKAVHDLIRTRADRATADKAVRGVLQAVKRAEFFGEIDPSLNLWFDFHGPLTVQDFNEHMDHLDDLHQRMFLFGLANDMALTDVIALNWTQARRLMRMRDLHPICREILETQVRNVRSDFVFWQYLDEFAPAPIYDADERIQRTIHCPWSDYRRRYATMTNRPF